MINQSEQLERESQQVDSVGWKVAERVTLIALVSIFLVTGVANRMEQIGEPLWLDEMHSAWVVDAPWNEVAERARAGNQGPLYFWIVKIAADRFPGSELRQLRWFSMVCGALVIPLSFYCAMCWTRCRLAATWVLCSVLIDPFFVFYSTEARPFAFLQLLAFLQLILLQRLFREGTVVENSTTSARGQRRILWVYWCWALLSVIGIYAHYTYVVFTFTQLAVLAAFSIRASDELKRMMPLFVSLAIAAACFPLIGPAIDIWNRKADWNDSTDWDSVWIQMRPSVFLLYVLPAMLVAALRLLKGRKKSTFHIPFGLNNHPISIAIFVSISVLVILVVLNAMGALYPRYHLPLGILCLCMSAILLAIFKCQKYQAMTIIGLLIVSLLGRYDETWLMRRADAKSGRGEAWTAISDHIKNEYEPESTVVILAAGLLEDFRLNETANERWNDYCRFPLFQLNQSEQWNQVVIVVASSEPKLKPQQRAQIRRANDILVVARGDVDQLYFVMRMIEVELGEHDFKKNELVEFQRSDNLYMARVTR